MKIVLQRVSEGAVLVDGTMIGSIGMGVVLLVAFGEEDTVEVADRNMEWMIGKVRSLRIFGDKEKPGSFMERSLDDVKGEVLLVSQFTLYGDCKKGTRPSFSHAASADSARELYSRFVERWKATGLKVQTGEFQAHMEVVFTNDGPVTLLLEH